MSDSIFHITSQSAWNAARREGIYRAPSLATEGFIHFSSRSQVVRVANRLFTGQKALVLLELAAHEFYPVRWEDCYEAGERFPHVYSELRCQDIARVVSFEASSDGSFCLPNTLRSGPSLHHLALRSADFQALSAFYQRVLEMTLVREARHAHWLAMGQGVVLMIEKRGEAEPAVDPVSERLVCWGVEDLAAAEAHLSALKVCVEERTDKTIYFRDPEGRKLGLSVHPLTT